jgi:hypothetical protein
VDAPNGGRIPARLPISVQREATREVALPMHLAHFGLSENPARPVHSILARAFVKYTNDMFAAVYEADRLAESEDPVTRAKFDEEFTHILKLNKEIDELRKWIYPSRAPLSPGEAFSRIASVASTFDDPDLAADLQNALQKREVGRPNRYLTYVKVFELMLQGRSVSFGIARRKLHPQLARECEPVLKAGVRALKRLLRRHAPDLVSQFEALHPDRAKKVNG